MKYTMINTEPKQVLGCYFIWSMVISLYLVQLVKKSKANKIISFTMVIGYK